MSEMQSEDMSTFLLQIKGDTSFSLFSQVTDVESLSETWKLCTKVAGHLEQGKRLENLSWRLFHLHSTMVADSVHDRTSMFGRISKQTGKKLDRERHLGLSQLQAPPLKKCRGVNQPMVGVSATIHHPRLLCSLSNSTVENGTGGLVNCTTITSCTQISFSPSHAWDFDFKTGSVDFESLISCLSPLSLLGAVDYFSQETFNVLENEGRKEKDSCTAWDFQDYLPLDGQTNEPPVHTTKRTIEPNKAEPEPNVTDIFRKKNPSSSSIDFVSAEPFLLNDWETHEEWVEKQFMNHIVPLNNQIILPSPHSNSNFLGELHSTEMKHSPNPSGKNKGMPHESIDLTLNTMETSCRCHIQTSLKKEKVGEKRKRRNPMATRLPKFVGVPAVPERSSGDNLPEVSTCSNCRGTHTPLWRRGPNDEILCNACGVFYKVHKKNRPPNLSKCRYLGNSSSIVESNSNSKGTRIECTNCNAKATPMWRRAPDGSLLCNACALYYKCHKRSRPINYSKSASSIPFDAVNQLPNFGYINNNTSIGMESLDFEFCDKDPNFLSDGKNTLSTSFDKTFDGRSIYLNESHEFDFFKTYPNSLYSGSNV